MFKRVSTFFAPPVFPEDEDKTRKAKYSHVIALAFVALVIAFETVVRFSVGYTDLSIFDLILIGVALICTTGLVLLRKGYVRLTSFLLVALVWLASNGIAATGYGARDASYLINFAIVLMAGLLLGWQASLLVTIASVVSGFALAYAEQNNWIGEVSYSITSFVRDMTFVFSLNGILIYLLINGLENALRKSRLNLVQLESANINLSNTQNELQNRSAELVAANQQLENRTKKLHAIAIVTRTAGSIQDFDLLLGSITSTISQQLGYYQVGLFLLDEKREFAMLRSTNSASGPKMLKNEYRIDLRQNNPISFVAQTARPRMIESGDQESAFSNSPEFQFTRSELLLPLKSAEQVIGVLDLHSTEDNAFSEDDISILSLLADQVAITIHNLLLYEEAQSALRRADVTSTQAAAQAWKGYKKAIQTKGYRYDGIKSEVLNNPTPTAQGNNALSVPIQLRGQTIGSFKLNPSDPSRAWSEDELVMVRATAERVALALEGVRLLEEAQKRATREAFLSEVATKLSASFQLDSILRDTVQELGQTLKNSTVTFQLVNPAEGDYPTADTNLDTPQQKTN